MITTSLTKHFPSFFLHLIIQSSPCISRLPTIAPWRLAAAPICRISLVQIIYWSKSSTVYNLLVPTGYIRSQKLMSIGGN